MAVRRMPELEKSGNQQMYQMPLLEYQGRACDLAQGISWLIWKQSSVSSGGRLARQGDFKRGGENCLKVWSNITWCKHFLRWGSPAGREGSGCSCGDFQAQGSCLGRRWSRKRNVLRMVLWKKLGLDTEGKSSHFTVRDGQLVQLLGEAKYGVDCTEERGVERPGVCWDMTETCLER